MTLNIYLTFDGNCREVFEFYRSAFGGEFSIVQTFGDGPPDMGVPEDERDRIMHVSFPVGSSVLMGSDTVTGFGPPGVKGDNFSVSCATQSREETDELFAKISEGGTVTMPLAEMFWGSYFGTCTDKFGIKWQFNFEQGS
jgi:PhnB protein